MRSANEDNSQLKLLLFVDLISYAYMSAGIAMPMHANTHVAISMGFLVRWAFVNGRSAPMTIHAMTPPFVVVINISISVAMYVRNFKYPLRLFDVSKGAHKIARMADVSVEDLANPAIR